MKTMRNEVGLANVLASLRRFTFIELDDDERAKVLNEAVAPDETVASFIAGLPVADVEFALRTCTRAGVLEIWAYSTGRAFRKIVAENPHTPEAALTILAAGYDEVVSVTAYERLMERAHARDSSEDAERDLA